MSDCNDDLDYPFDNDYDYDEPTSTDIIIDYIPDIEEKIINKAKVDNKKKVDNKEKVDNVSFEFNEQTIDFFTKDFNMNIKKILVNKSKFNNDTILLCLLFKNKIMTEYRCNVKKCKVGKSWLGKPIQLLINRKNGRMEDLTISNLELICPNCFIIQYGLELFNKVIAQTIFKCKICNYPLHNFGNSKKKEGFCLSCESKMINASYYSNQSAYYNELKNTIDNTSKLKQDEFTTSKYYNEVSKYKKINTNTTSSKPLIPLNMSIPDIKDLIKET